MTPIKLRFLMLYLWLSAFQPTPPKQPEKKCSVCGCMNAAERKHCIECKAPV